MKKDLNMEMKKKKKFVVPGVLQVCEVALEVDLLVGGSTDFTSTADVHITGQKTDDLFDSGYNSDQWSAGAGSDFD